MPSDWLSGFVTLNPIGLMLFPQSPLDADKEFVLQPHMDDINRLFSAPTLEGIFHDLEKDGSDWALKQLNTLKKMVGMLFVRSLGRVPCEQIL